MSFSIKIDPEAIEDIQNGIDWYNEQQKGLGRKFHREVKLAFKSIKSNPFFQVRYDRVRCLPLSKFPFMIHFTVNESEKIVAIRAVFNTSRNPDIWMKR
ncbi:type II toxin-antitoxin system RelE/ParE family toxin [Owenweeksia hongkongensis]|uniref:type II toxin-antitoxin system RelE/ParE family toxin n=1 Tax=Owenweeksia hongkongensis TaxID=253245 RepID=UPI003A8FF0E4